MFFSLESYGALLLPDVKSSEDTLGSGAVADIFSVADGIHVSLGFNGIFTSKGLCLVISIFRITVEQSIYRYYI